MEISTKEIESKLRDKAWNIVEPLVDNLIAEGKSKKEILTILDQYIKAKTSDFYHRNQKLKGPETWLKQTLEHIAKIRGDSKAEYIFYELLQNNEIPFHFQYPIGPYKADYLIDEDLVVELDGPSHKNTRKRDTKKDEYLEKKGYRVLRVPLDLAIMDSDMVIEGIQEARQSKDF